MYHNNLKFHRGTKRVMNILNEYINIYFMLLYRFKLIRTSI